MQITLESPIQVLDRLIDSVPQDFLGKPIWLLQVNTKTGGQYRVKIEAATKEEAHRWVAVIGQKILKEGWLVASCFFREASLREHFTDNAKSFL